MKCLIIDSSAASRLWLNQQTTDLGWLIEEAESGQEGLSKFSAGGIDLILISIYLHDMDAIHFASLLRAKENVLHVPIIMITFQEDHAPLIRAISTGITEVCSRENTQKLRNILKRFAQRQNNHVLLQGHVLYAEDSLTVAIKTQASLTQQGLMVEHVKSAETALQALKQKNYDLILTDIVLEGKMSGLDLTREIRSLAGKKSRIPILITTRFHDPAQRLDIFVAGANDYIAKPALEEELIGRVKNQLLYKKLLDLNEEQHQQMQSLTLHDQLTGLYNRNVFMELAPAKLSEAKRHQISVSMILADIDQLQAINDIHGEAAGDTILKMVAGILKSGCRKEDLLARVGGEEFVLLLSSCQEGAAFNKAERIRQQITQQQQGWPITISFGVAEYQTDQNHDLTELFQQANRALLRAKLDGKNRVIANSSLHEAPLGHPNKEPHNSEPGIKINTQKGIVHFDNNAMRYYQELSRFGTSQLKVLGKIRSALIEHQTHQAKNLALSLTKLFEQLGMEVLHDKTRQLVSALHRSQQQEANQQLKELQSLVQYYSHNLHLILEQLDYPGDPEDLNVSNPSPPKS